MSNLEYQYQCGGCVYYDFQGDYKKGYCSWYRSYYYPGDNCSHQKPVNATSGCYITTIVCDVLGLDDDCSLLISLWLSIVSDNDCIVVFTTSIIVSDFEGVSFILVSVAISTVDVVGAVFFLKNNIIYLQ